MSTLDTILTGLGIGITVIVAGLFAFTLTLSPCPTEDSTYCYWNASERSNGEGISFIAFGEGQMIITGESK